MSTHIYQVVDELRQSQRFPKEPGSTFAVIWRSGGEDLLVEVRDDSLGGLGLLVDDRWRIAVGDEVAIVYAGRCVHAVARHVEPHDDGRSLVGFECDRPLADHPPAAGE